ncbi:hypothetical protein LIP_1057 [Limnochorda pilosa]|uniref:Uncharacterized protein n=1 Tax=Limnochorda pilosa TaxID=1555112 RepID=A0A0K2SJ86_LIMPI|nr:hypothetical protein LIP_1057 [Limnochorda pilosa]
MGPKRMLPSLRWPFVLAVLAIHLLHPIIPRRVSPGCLSATLSDAGFALPILRNTHTGLIRLDGVCREGMARGSLLWQNIIVAGLVVGENGGV